MAKKSKVDKGSAKNERGLSKRGLQTVKSYDKQMKESADAGQEQKIHVTRALGRHYKRSQQAYMLFKTSVGAVERASDEFVLEGKDDAKCTLTFVDEISARYRAKDLPIVESYTSGKWLTSSMAADTGLFGQASASWMDFAQLTREKLTKSSVSNEVSQLLSFQGSLRAAHDGVERSFITKYTDALKSARAEVEMKFPRLLQWEKDSKVGPCFSPGLGELMKGVLAQYSPPLEVTSEFNAEVFVQCCDEVVDEILSYASEQLNKDGALDPDPLTKRGDLTHEEIDNLTDEEVLMLAGVITSEYDDAEDVSALGRATKNSGKGWPIFSTSIVDRDDSGRATGESANQWRAILHEAYDLTQGNYDWEARFSVLGQRLQNSKLVEHNGVFSFEPKVRNVNGGSFPTFVAEATAWRPISRAMREHPSFKGYLGVETLHTAKSGYSINGFFDAIDELESLGERWHLASLDFSAFDATLKYVMPLVWDSLKRLVPARADMFEVLKDDYSFCPLATPYGVFRGKHGLFSGKLGTSFIGSILNLACVKYAMKHMNCKLIAHLAFGDDTVALFTSPDDHTGLIDVSDAFKVMGMVVNPDPRKQVYVCYRDTDRTPEISFLARTWYYDYRYPVFPLSRALANLYRPEKTDIRESAIRALDIDPFSAIVIDSRFGINLTAQMMGRCISGAMNASYHPCYEWMARWVCENLPFNAIPKLWMGDEATKAIIIANTHADHSLLRGGLEKNKLVQQVTMLFATEYAQKVGRYADIPTIDVKVVREEKLAATRRNERAQTLNRGEVIGDAIEDLMTDPEIDNYSDDTKAKIAAALQLMFD